MVLIGILNVLSSSAYFCLFIMVQMMKVRRREHILLSLVALALFQWNLSAYFVYNGTNTDVLRTLIPFSCIGMFFLFPLNFHFAWAVRYKRGMPLPLAICLYLPAAFLSVFNFISPISVVATASAEGKIEFSIAAANPVHLVWMVYYLITWILPAIFYFQYRRLTALRRERLQATLLSRIILISTALIMGEYYLSGWSPGWDIPSQSPALFLPWVITMFYAIWKYGFLRIAPEQLTKTILDAVEDLVVLYDPDGRIAYMNRKALSILGDVKAVAAGSHQIIEREVRPLICRIPDWRPGDPDRLCTLTITKSDGGEGIKIDARIKPLFDRFSDPLGLLFSGTVVPRLSDILGNYGITRREAEVLEYLMCGWTSRQIAKALSVTERTVKAHITKLYEKTGAGNRVQLLNLLTAGGSPKA